MGKTYIDTVKYLVFANVEISGLVEKPDVVGAIFGQTEGLLGDELDLRELQKNGRIGRIEVDMQPRGGKSIGKIKLPSSLDMVETSILAAALETVDRVGPCDARIGIEKIEDTRNVKRKGLVDRAKYLLKNMLTSEIPESREISEQVRAEVKTAEISSYGADKLPAGPGIERESSIILCEGRADVINLLKNDITNVVGVGGANVSPTVAKLCQEKEVTVFLDGDRGGDIIMAELARIAEIDFVARAPSGKEVEELTRKEIIKCLRSKVPYEQGSTGPGEEDRRLGRYRPNAQGRAYPPRREEAQAAPQPEGGYVGRQARMPAYHREEPSYSQPRDREQFQQGASVNGSQQPQGLPAPNVMAQAYTPAPAFEAPATILPQKEVVAAQRPVYQEPAPAAAPAEEAKPMLPEVPRQLMTSLDELENTLRARFYDKDFNMTKEIPVRDMIKSLEGEPSVFGVVFDGIITQRLADLASSKSAQVLVGIKMGNVFRKPAGVLLHTKQ